MQSRSHKRFTTVVARRMGTSWGALKAIYDPSEPANLPKPADKERYELIWELMQQVEKGDDRETAARQLLAMLKRDRLTPEDEKHFDTPDKVESLLRKAEQRFGKDEVIKR